MQERKLLHGFRERRGIDGLRAKSRRFISTLLAAAGKEGAAKEE